MVCPHPGEELQRVFEGSYVARAGRMLCGLCGELLYVAEERSATVRAREGATGDYPPMCDISTLGRSVVAAERISE